MSSDLTGILKEWEYDPDKSIRIIHADDGRQVLQVRLPLGLEQYELSGRPDGAKPFGMESMLLEMKNRLEQHVGANGSDEGFEILHDDFTLLQNEGIMYYYRYLLLFQIGEFHRVVLDTEHNLKLCTLVEQYSYDVDDRISLLQYKPYILRMNVMATAMGLVGVEKIQEAEKTIQEGIAAIQNMEEVDSPVFQFERIRSVNYLESALKHIKEKKTNPLDELRSELEQAVEEENYERAAQLRDQIREMSSR